MIIRSAQNTDLPAILNLFKTSLGEEGGIPEESFWKWKHHQNPFGVSPTLLAFDNEKLVGLRTFLCWRFRRGDDVFKGYRAVDTATHPQYQGRGIFKKLTLQLIEEIKNSERSIIYNTPNQLSLPGYLKMGWNKMGKTPLLIKPLPFAWIRNKVVKSEIKLNRVVWNDDTEGFLKDILHSWRKNVNHFVTTDYSVDYLRWRYVDIPGFTYGLKIHSDQDSSCAIFYRIKQSGKLRELRVVDFFYSGRVAKRLVRNTLHAIARETGSEIITILNDSESNVARMLPFGFFSARKRGLLITYREVNDKSLHELASQQHQWFFTSGTLELF